MEGLEVEGVCGDACAVTDLQQTGGRKEETSINADLGPTGVIYIACGQRFVDEAIRSARSVRKCMPELPIVLMTDHDRSLAFDFDRVVPLKVAAYTQIDRVAALNQFQFERTLFLDSDTLMVRRCDALFKLLDKFELGAAFEPARHMDSYEDQSIPDAFAEINCGMLVYRRSPAVRQLFGDWFTTLRAGYVPGQHVRDQPMFRGALYRSEVKFRTLPVEYNLRTDYPGMLPAGAVPAILHGRNRDVDGIMRIFGSSKAGRVYLPSAQRFSSKHFLILSPRLNSMLQRLMEGFQWLALRRRNWSQWGREKF